MDNIQPKPRKTIKSVSKALAILKVFQRFDNVELGLTELSEYLKIPKSTASFLINTLEKEEFLKRNPTGKYSLGLKLFELGHIVGQQMDLRKHAIPYLKKLVDIFDETAHLVVLNQDQAYYIEKVEGKSATRIPSQVGRYNALHCTAVGKVLMASLEQSEVERIIEEKGLPRLTEYTICDPERLKDELKSIRDQGYGIDNEELESGLFCIAAPVRDHQGVVVAAISVSGHVSRILRKDTDKLIKDLKQAADGISGSLGYSGPA